MAATKDGPVALSDRSDLESFVAERDRALVEFHTEGCGKCAAMEPVLDAIAKTTDVGVATMNPRDDPQLVDAYDVRSVPKLLVFVDGELAATREDGVLSVAETRSFVRDA